MTTTEKLLPFCAALALSACKADWQTQDMDGDGVSIAEGDCWDRVEGPGGTGLSGADIHPGATETWYDGFDQDCGEDDDYDADGDGFVLDAFVGLPTVGVPGSGGLPGGDCWDDPNTIPDNMVAAPGFEQLAASEVNPGAKTDTWYDGIDQDCDGQGDFDQDGDGFDSSEHPQADGQVGDDCDDLDPAIHPDATEVCDDIDNDCDTLVDGDDPTVDPDSIRDWYIDADSDGYGTYDTEIEACDQPDGFVDNPDDCDDGDPTRNPGMDEVCNEVDDDCNGVIDEAAEDAPIWYIDADLDGYGTTTDAVASCDQPAGFVDNPDDCNDSDPEINPDAAERCATVGVDDDCDGDVDEADAIDTTVFFSDLDGDGYGLDSLTLEACSAPVGFAEEPGDCDDTDAAIHPGADELCSTVGVDDDCDDLVDEGDAVDATVWTIDADLDGYGQAGGATVTACEQPPGYVDNEGDCDDTCEVCWTGATEVCNDGEDNDCDGTPNDCAIDSAIDLSAAGLVLSGGSSGDEYGLSVESGDLDGDGQVDIIVGARSAGGTGRAYAYLGPVTADRAVDDAALRLSGSNSGDKGGRGVALVDIDDDGYDDAIVSASAGGSGRDRGLVAVVYGPASGAFDLDAADWTLNAAANYTYLGRELADLGDVDGDEVADFAVSTTALDVNGTNDGALYVLTGASTGTSDIAAEAVLLWGASAGDQFSQGSAGVGDFDGDGIGDLVVGANLEDTADTNAGAAYLFLGPIDTDRSAADADARWTGEAERDNAGDAVAGGVDVNGDGTLDVVIGAPQAGASDEGSAYLVSGSSAPSSGSLGDADAIVRGTDTDQHLGIAVAMFADLDGDGTGDLGIADGTRASCSSDAAPGHSFLFYGALSGATTVASADVTITGGATGDCAGAQLRSIGDLSGDGNPDVAVGAPGAEGSGAVYIIEGVGF